MTVNYIPDGYQPLLPYLQVKNAPDAIDFYKKAFNAKEIGRITMEGNIVGHAEIELFNARLLLAEVNEKWGNKSPQQLGGSPVCLCLYVKDVDAVFNQALAAGATITNGMKVEDQFYGDRAGSLTDPFGHQWTILTHKEDVPFDELQRRAENMCK